MPKPQYIQTPNTDLSRLDARIMNVLMGARNLQHSSSQSKLNVPPLPKLGQYIDGKEMTKIKKSSSKDLSSPPAAAEPPSQHAKRVTFSKHRRNRPQTPQSTVKDSEMQTGLTSCLITSPSLDSRASGGANNPAERKVGWLARTDSECQFKAPGLMFLQEKDTNVVTFEVKMRDSLQSVHDYTTKCDYFPKFEDKRKIKDQTTQTLYRESSAQTVAYLPDILDKELDENLELFNLPNILSGDKAPGLYEVEILERARKRWAFNKALKTNFKKQLDEAREKAIKSKFRPILEAFEWEHWIEREEYIQECQMMRLEIVIRMFDKREMEMHNASKQRIEAACYVIEKRRQHGLHKNEIEYQRAMRRLQIKNSGLSRRWKKQYPLQALASPCSEFWGPLIRHGVDPARRNFVGDGRKAFDMRIDELEQRVNMTQLVCPFRKLKEWSKPKEYVKEYEQNFCSDKHLEKLYESLKTLRSQANKQKTAPKCLKKRPQPPSEADLNVSFDYEGVDATDFFKDRVRRTDGKESQIKEDLSPEQMLAIRNYLEDLDQKDIPDFSKKMQMERRTEDLEQLLHMYEGSTIGWIMQFLSEEMERLKEQRKLHFFSILAQKERWRREAAEAGLRQKENEMRLLYEDMFQQSNAVHSQITDEYIQTILTKDMSHIAVCEATESVVVLAKQIDADIRRWLESFKLIQTPLTYEPLREMLRSMVSPDLDAQLIKYEKNLIVQYIIDDILFPGIWEEMESYDIATTMMSDLIDRLIDNDLYLFSTDSEPDEPQRKGWYEAEAIIRKLIRQAVPGRRWKTETERIVHENCESLFDDIFEQIMNKKLDDMEPIELTESFSDVHFDPKTNIHENRLVTAIIKKKMSAQTEIDDADDEMTKHLKTEVLSLQKKMKLDRVTGSLTQRTQYTDERHSEVEKDTFIKQTVFVPKPRLTPTNRHSDIFSVISTLDILEEPNFKELRHAKASMSSPTGQSAISLRGIVFDDDQTQTKIQDQALGSLMDILNVQPVKDYEADDESSSWVENTLDYDYEGYDEPPTSQVLESEKRSAELPSPKAEEEMETTKVKMDVMETVETYDTMETYEGTSQVVKQTSTLLMDQEPEDNVKLLSDKSSVFKRRLGSKSHTQSSSNYGLTVVTEEQTATKATGSKISQKSDRE